MSDAAQPSARRTAVVWTVAFTNFAFPFMFSGVGVAVPAMGRDLAMSGAALGLFETLYLGTAAALMLPAGRLSDASDKNSWFTLGVVVFALTTLTLAFLPTVPLLLSVRIVQGVSAALVAATNMALLTEVVPRERLGRAIGLSIGAVYTGLSGGPFAAGMITTALGWRWVFGLSGVFASGAAVLSLVLLRRRWRWPRLAFDWPGTVTSAAGIVLVLVGSAKVAEGATGWWLLGLGVASLVAFLVIEPRITAPLVPVRALFARRVLVRALLVQLLTYAGAMGTAFLFSLYLQVARGWEAREAGWLLVIAPVLMASLAPVSGRAADRIRPQLIAAIGTTLIMLGTVAGWLVADTGSLVLIVISLACHGVGFATFSSPNMTVIMSNAPREHTATASALASLMRTMGMVGAMTLVTGFMAVKLGPEGVRAPHAEAGLVATMRGSLAVISGLSVWAMVTAWRDAPGARTGGS